MKSIFKFFKLIFSFKTKYNKKNNIYQRKSLVNKIFTIIWMFLMPLGTLAFGYFLAPLIFTDIVIGILTILLYISLCTFTVENLTMYSVLGFRNMFISTVEKIANKKIDEFQTRNFDVNGDEILIKEEKMTKEEYKEIAKNKPKKRYYRGIDLIIGILGTILAIAFVILAVLVAFQSLFNLLSSL